MDLFDLLGVARDEPDDLPQEREVAIDLNQFTVDNVPVATTDSNRDMLEALRDVIDPEVGVNIVDLGLVYAVEAAQSYVDVVLTMTTPACPMSAMIEADVREALQEFGHYEEIGVAIIFEPPWSPDMMSERARIELRGY